MHHYECELCGCVSRDQVCDRCYDRILREFEDGLEALREERHIIDELTARAALGLQLNNPL